MGSLIKENLSPLFIQFKTAGILYSLTKSKPLDNCKQKPLENLTHTKTHIPRISSALFTLDSNMEVLKVGPPSCLLGRGPKSWTARTP